MEAVARTSSQLLPDVKVRWVGDPGDLISRVIRRLAEALGHPNSDLYFTR